MRDGIIIGLAIIAFFFFGFFIGGYHERNARLLPHFRQRRRIALTRRARNYFK